MKENILTGYQGDLRMEDNIKILPGDKVEKSIDVKIGIAKIFAEGFSQWLGFFSKDKNKIEKAFSHMFLLDKFYVAIIDNEVAGMVACTDCKSLVVKLNKKELRRHLGFYKGTLASIFLKKEFEALSKNPPLNTGSIGFVGTSSKFRRKGIASKIIKYIIENTTYKEYIIEEVADTNSLAMNLYAKMGFVEYKNKPLPKKRAVKIGINSFISLKYIKG